MRDAASARLVPGPRILAAGRGIGMTSGHGWQLIGRQADGPGEVRKAVREQLRLVVARGRVVVNRLAA